MYKVRLIRVSEYGKEDFVSGIDGLMMMIVNLILNPPGFCTRYPYMGFDWEAKKHIIASDVAMLDTLKKDLQNMVNENFMDDGLNIGIDLLVEVEPTTNSPTMHLVIKEDTVGVEVNSSIKGIDAISYSVKVKDFSK